METIFDKPLDKQVADNTQAIANINYIEDLGTPTGWESGKLYRQGKHIWGQLYKELSQQQSTSSGRLVNFATIPYSLRGLTYCTGQFYANQRYFSCTYQIDSSGNIILISPVGTDMSVGFVYIYLDAYLPD